MSKNEETIVPVGAKFVIEVDGKKGYLKALSKQTLEQVLSLAMPSNGEPQYVRAGEVILNSCWVGGDDEIKTNDELLVPAAFQAYSLVEIKEASIKKL